MFFSRSVQILRSASGSYDEDGNWQDGVQQTLDVVANVQVDGCPNDRAEG